MHTEGTFAGKVQTKAASACTLTRLLEICLENIDDSLASPCTLPQVLHVSKSDADLALVLAQAHANLLIVSCAVPTRHLHSPCLPAAQCTQACWQG